MQVNVLNPFGVEAEVRPWEVKRVRPREWREVVCLLEAFLSSSSKSWEPSTFYKVLGRAPPIHSTEQTL